MSVHSSEGGYVFVPVTIAGTTVLELVGTGSPRTLLDACVFTSDRLKGFRSSARSENELLLGAPGNQIPIGRVSASWITCSVDAGCILVDVVKDLPTKAVLGLDSYRALMLSIVYSGTSFELRVGGWKMREIHSIRLWATEDHPSVGTLKQLCLSYPDMRNGGDRPLATKNLTKYVVTLKEGVEPYSQPPRTERQYKRNPRGGSQGSRGRYHEPSEFPRGACSVLVSRTGNETEDRLCADYREPKSRPVVPRSLLPRIRQALDALQGKAYFSLFDLPAAYYQMELEEPSRPVLAFQREDGHSQPTRVPFGAARAAATQQRMVDNLLAGMKWSCASAYLDERMLPQFVSKLRLLSEWEAYLEKACVHLQQFRGHITLW
ncbi:hypothetical protein Efla_001291 [Eimeria flavescens]